MALMKRFDKRLLCFDGLSNQMLCRNRFFENEFLEVTVNEIG